MAAAFLVQSLEGTLLLRCAAENKPSSAILFFANPFPLTPQETKIRQLCENEPFRDAKQETQRERERVESPRQICPTFLQGNLSLLGEKQLPLCVDVEICDLNGLAKDLNGGN